MRPVCFAVLPIACILACVLLAACGGEESRGVSPSPNLPRSQPQVGETYAQCSGRSGGGEDRSAAVTNTIAALASKDEVNCTDKHTFNLDGRQVFLVYLAHGEVMDCPAGCMSSDLCAIYDDPQVYLYETSDSPAPDRPGRSHPVTQTAEFASFRAAQGDSGNWRFCFRSS